MDNAQSQVKFTIESGIVAAFKARCAQGGVSMTSEVRRFMKACLPVKEQKPKTVTRPMRKKAVMDIIASLNIIVDMEAEYRDNIPEQFTQRYDTADHTCDLLADAIAALEDAY